MQIPTQYRGRWRGEIVDVERTKKYVGEIILDADEVRATYCMARGTKEGELTLQFQADGFLVLKEVVDSWSGTLMLYLDSDDKLKCVWRSGSRLSSEATMTRQVS